MSEIMIAVGAVIRDEKGSVLLVKHVPERGGYWQGKWICPGGRLNFGESIKEGILREVDEETGLEIRLTFPLIPFERIVKEGDKTYLHVIYIDYLAEKVGGQPRPGGDAGILAWLSPQEIAQRWDELHPDTQRLMKIAQVMEGENLELISP